MRPFFAFVLMLAASAMAQADKIVLFAGGDGQVTDNQAKNAKLIQPFAVDFAPDGSTTYIVEMVKGERLSSVAANGTIATLAGKYGEKGFAGNGEKGPNARFNGMHNLVVGPRGVVFLADTWNNCVRTYDPKDGIVRAFAGTGKKGFAGDGGPVEKAQFGGVYCLAFDRDRKNLYLSDLDNRRIRKVELATRVVTTVAGNGQKGVPKEGEEAIQQPLLDPRAHTVDANGNLWILERGGHVLRVVDKQGKIRTVAGTGKAGMGTGPAREAALNGPKHLGIDRDGSVLIADTENHRIVRYNPKDETIAMVAGTGKKGTSGVGGDPLKAQLNQPHGVAVHPKTGDIYISDSSNGRVLKIVRE